MADAELEASEVLHSLLSVERVENKSLPSNNATTSTDIDDSNILWHTPVYGVQSTLVHGDKVMVQSDNQDQVRYTNYGNKAMTMIYYCSHGVFCLTSIRIFYG